LGNNAKAQFNDENQNLQATKMASGVSQVPQPVAVTSKKRKSTLSSLEENSGEVGIENARTMPNDGPVDEKLATVERDGERQGSREVAKRAENATQGLLPKRPKMN
jgi:hypothetical protein